MVEAKLQHLVGMSVVRWSLRPQVRFSVWLKRFSEDHQNIRDAIAWFDRQSVVTISLQSAGRQVLSISSQLVGGRYIVTAVIQNNGLIEIDCEKISICAV